MTDPTEPMPEADDTNLSTGHQNEGDARRPSDTLDRGQPESTEGRDPPKRKSSLT